MAKTDTLSGDISIRTDLKLTTAIGSLMTSFPRATLGKIFSFTDGTGTSQAEGWLTGVNTVTTDGITWSLADSVDPFGAGGDDVPENGYDPEGKKIKAILILNNDSTNYVTLGLGAHPPTDILAGTTPTHRIAAGSFYLYVNPKGTAAIEDGVNDELSLTANTATCSCEALVVYG